LLDFDGGGDIGELNEAELLDSSDLTDVEGFHAPSNPSVSQAFPSTAFSAVPPSGFEFGGFESSAPIPTSSDASFGFDSSFATPVSSNPSFGFETSTFTPQAASTGFFVPETSSQATYESSSSSFSAQPTEESPLAKYQQAHRKRMEEKDEESIARKAVIVEDAKREIAEYLAERQKRTRKNREKHERSSQSCQSAQFNPELPWSNISSLADLNALRQNSKDVSRFRDVLRSLA